MLPPPEFVAHYREHVVPRLRRACRSFAYPVAAGYMDYTQARARISQIAMRGGSLHLPERFHGALERWCDDQLTGHVERWLDVVEAAADFREALTGEEIVDALIGAPHAG